MPSGSQGPRRGGRRREAGARAGKPRRRTASGAAGSDKRSDKRARRQARRRGTRGRRKATWSLRGLVIALLLVVGVPLSVIGLMAVVPPPTTAFMLQRAAQARTEGDRDFTVDYRWLPRRAIHDHAALAVMAAEDQRFPLHHGFDVAQLRAAISARLDGQPLRGASTLTQQLAKNLFLWPGKSFGRKALEAYLTTLIEMSWSKARVLEVYLNVVEFGDGVYGIEAASQRFYGHSATTLSAPEAALLAAALPAPGRYQVTRPDAHMRRKQRWVQSQMRVLAGWGWLARLAWADARPREPRLAQQR